MLAACGGGGQDGSATTAADATAAAAPAAPSYDPATEHDGTIEICDIVMGKLVGNIAFAGLLFVEAYLRDL
ncbi:MAG: hypothetical protein ACKO7U_00325, partial [Actinomycetota bacterium]